VASPYSPYLAMLNEGREVVPSGGVDWSVGRHARLPLP
jgi:hypothetical protein